MTINVVDTNVPVVANGRTAQADPACVLSCIEALAAIHRRGVVGLDDAMRILEEYRRNLSMTGQPGAGDYFMKWVWTMQANEQYCRQFPITPQKGDPNNFEEFPTDNDLAAFDISDRKFVAVAVKIGPAHLILNAVDSDWAQFHAPLVKNGINIRFLCPQHICPGVEAS